jgi:Spy/CpxP family protein refolding chaperone
VTRASIIIALVATFLIGASLGLMGGIMFGMHHRGPRTTWSMSERGRRAPGTHGGTERRVMRHTIVMPRLREALDLTDAQAARIEPLIEETHKAMGAVRESLEIRIGRVLTPEQRERWRRLQASREFPAQSRGPRREGDRAHRAQPGEEGEPK